MSPKLRRRIAIVLMAVVFSLPFLGENIDKIGAILFLLGPDGQKTRPVLAETITAGVGLFLLLQMIGYFGVAWLVVVFKERWFGPVRFQIQLRTGLLLMLVAALLLFLNTQVRVSEYRTYYGFPTEHGMSSYPREGPFPWWQLIPVMGFNLFVAWMVLYATAVFCENVVWRRKKNQPQPESDETPLQSPPRAPTLHGMPLTRQEKIFYALPMFVCFGLVLLSSILAENSSALARQYGLDRGFFLTIAASIKLRANPAVTCLTMLGIAIFYFKWVCQHRRTVVFFNILILFIVYLYLFVLALAVIGVFFNTSSPRKK